MTKIKRSTFSFTILVMILSIFLFLIFEDTVSSSDSSNILEFEEGMEYEYEHKFSGYVFDIYVTIENVESWQGITVQQGDTTTVTRFKLIKEDLELYVTDPLNMNKVLDDEIEGYKLTFAASQSPIIMPLTLVYNKQLYGFDFDELIENHSITTFWQTSLGKKTTELTLEGPIEYTNYDVYKISIIETDEIIYISTVEPYLLIDHYYPSSSKVIELNAIRQKSFDIGEYNITNPSFNQQPKAEFSYFIDNLTVEFNASDSYDKDGKIITYEWHFGDSTNGSGINPTHNYSIFGNYTVILTVTDDEGKNKSVSQDIVLDSSNIDGENGTVEKDSQSPGFELIIVFFTIAIILFWKRYR